MTPLRADDISLLCEDRGEGRSQKLIEAAVQALHDTLPFAKAVRPIGVSNKNDVQVRTRFARAERLRAFGVRDRDFLLRPLLDRHRASAFARVQDVKPWPLSRHSIESYLLDDDVLSRAAFAGVPEGALQAALDRAVAARRWLDAVRGTLEDLAFRVRKVRQQSISHPPTDRASALAEVERVAEQMRRELADESEGARLSAHLDALAEDMVSDEPLRCRVDGRALIYDLERELQLARGTILDKLTTLAIRSPPDALVADLRAVLQAVPQPWQHPDA